MLSVTRQHTSLDTADAMALPLDSPSAMTLPLNIPFHQFLCVGFLRIHILTQKDSCSIRYYNLDLALTTEAYIIIVYISYNILHIICADFTVWSSIKVTFLVPASSRFDSNSSNDLEQNTTCNVPGIPLLFQKSSLQPHLWKTKSKTGNIWAALNPGRCWEPWGHYQGDQGNATKPTKATPRHGICKVSRLKELRRWSLGPTSELHSRTGTARQGP